MRVCVGCGKGMAEGVGCGGVVRGWRRVWGVGRCKGVAEGVGCGAW